MAVISFWGNSEKETGQTIATMAISTMMAFEHNYKILTISTGFKDRTMDESFWPANRATGLQRILGTQSENFVNMESGIEGLGRVVESNRLRKGLIPNYAKVVFTNRLDVLVSPRTENPKEYIEIAKTYPSIIETAANDYNMVFVDIDKRLPTEIQRAILTKSDVIIITAKQGQQGINKLNELTKKNEMFQGDNILKLIGKYDASSKYNVKNISRELRERKLILSVPYNTIFFETTMEGKVPDYFLKFRGLTVIDKNDSNMFFLSELKRDCEIILEKIREVELKR